MKRYILSVAVVIEAILIALGVWLFCSGQGGKTVAASAESRETEAYTTEAPENLARLQSADDGQLEVWAENLKSFDGREYGYVTPADNQFQRDTCWAFAAVGAAEASILREGCDPSANKDNLNFDEYVAAYTRFNRDGTQDPLHLTDNDTFGDKWDQGSFSHMAFAIMSQGHSLVKEENYYPYDDVIKSHVAQSDYFLQSYIRIPNNPTAIKLAVLKYGAVTMEYNSPGGFYNYSYRGSGKSTNHASIIVGWNDNTDRSLFGPSKPTSNGAWIVKNSWGEHGFEKNGAHCFYLSYESYLNNNLYAVDLAPRTEYQNLYYYDGQLATSGRTYAVTEQAAIYEAKLTSATVQEQLKAVVVECAQSNLDVDIKIYRNLTVNPGNVNDEMNVPDKGSPVAEISAHVDYQGLYTFDLPTPLDLNQGEYFSIVVKCTNEFGSVVPVPSSADGGSSVNDMTYHRYDGEWESYKRSQGYADTSSDNMSARIRAVTNTIERSAPLDNDLQYARVEIPDRLLFYARGQELAPVIDVYFGSVLLEKDRDYTVVIRDNTTPGMATVEINGKGKYFGTRKTYFEVAKQKYPPNVMPSSVDVYDDTVMLYQIPIPADWEWINGNYKLEYGYSYFAVSLKYVGDDREFYQITTCDFHINKIRGTAPSTIDISEAEIEVIGEYTYTGKPITPTVSVNYQGRTLIDSVQYTLTCDDNLNAGQATVTVAGRNGYFGERRLTFEIKKADYPFEKPHNSITVSKKARTLSDVELGYENWSWKAPQTKIDGQTVAVAVYDGRDKDNFINTELEITIVAGVVNISEISELSLAQTDFIYDGSGKTPDVVALDGKFALEKGVDFNVDYVENVNAGEAAAIISGINDYDGEITLKFTIQKAVRQNFTVSQSGWTFGDSSPSPAVTGCEETAAVTYLYSTARNGHYTANTPVNAGSYFIKATIASSKNYEQAESIAAFTVERRSISGFLATVDGDGFTYSGREIKPKISVGGTAGELIENTDFSVSYFENVNAGTATAKITGIANYTGSLTISFTIQKATEANFDTTLRLDKGFENLSEIELPEGFIWDESSLVSSGKNSYRATAYYTGGNYNFESIEFEILVSESPAQPYDYTWLAAVIPVAVAVAAAIAIAAIFIRRTRRGK